MLQWHCTVSIQAESETRICARIDSVVESFNEVLRVGLGEVQAKYEISMPDWLVEWDAKRDGKLFPKHLLSEGADFELFQITLLEFRGLDIKTCSYITRDLRRFFGCFIFTEEAKHDLANLLVSIFKHGFLKKVVVNQLWQAKPNYLKSLRHSLKHLVEYLENEERTYRCDGHGGSSNGSVWCLSVALATVAVCRSIGGLTTCLHTIGRALEYELKSHLGVKEKARSAARAAKDARLIEQWCGSRVWKGMVRQSFKGLKYIFDHKDDEGFWDKWTHSLANQFLLVIIYCNTYPGRGGHCACCMCVQT